MNNLTDPTTNPVLEQALYYLETLGWSIIPVGDNKKPLIGWKKYQSSKLTREELISLFGEFKVVNIAVVTGKISGIAVIDVDPKNGGVDTDFANIKTVKSETPSGGWHYYFSIPAGKNFDSRVGIKPGIDSRINGGLALLPPSVLKNGKCYRWVNDPKDTPIIELPQFVVDWQEDGATRGTTSNERLDDILEGVEEGFRNDGAASAAGILLNRFPKDEWETRAWPLLKAINNQNKPPLEESELRGVFESIKERESSKKSENDEKEGPIALQLLEEIEKENILFFHDQNKDGFASISGDGREIHKLSSDSFREYLSYHFYKNSGGVVSAETTSNLIRLLEGKAKFEGPAYELQVRITRQDEAIWYDMGDGPVVYADKDGWNISETPPILFRRYNHQQIQIKPQLGGKVSDVCDFVNLHNEKQKLLLQVYLVSCFIPGFPHPLLVFYGPQGSGKTTPQRLLKMLIDPSVLKTLTYPDSQREFIQLAAHHYFLFLDNLSELPQWLSDSLAKASTGDGFSKRELFSDDDDVIYSFQRAIALNGITLVVERADLLDRCILLQLDRIPKEKRREEQEFWKDFEARRPQILGAIFTAVAGALKEYPNIHLTARPRMADFAAWGAAIAKALGYNENDFLEAYWDNINQQNQAALEASPVATAITTLMADKETWEGTASDLLAALEKIAEDLRINIRSKDWPKGPSPLSRKIQLISSNLAEDGIKLERDDKSRPKRILIQKVNNNADGADASTETSDSGLKSSPTANEQMALNSHQNVDGKETQSNQPASTLTASSTNSLDETETSDAQEAKEEEEIDVDF